MDKLQQGTPAFRKANFALLLLLSVLLLFAFPLTLKLSSIPGKVVKP